ncbi:MAG: endonuclease III [Candidatus Aenigmatarchaeota archaeon]|nr:endonuclease III [Candidatus Aenigmarchaeota archaeon]
MITKIIKILKKETVKFEKPAMEQLTKPTPFKVLISCLLSLRTKDKITIKASEKLFSIASTPHEISKLDLNKIENAIKNVNYYKTKAKRIKEISEELIQKYNGDVPDNIDDLLKLKGVGRKTANIVLIYAFGKNTIAVDTHVHRISNRIGIVKTKTPEKTEFELKKKIPPKFWKDYNNLLVTWGQNICLPTKPKCDACKIKYYCKKIGVKGR